MEVSLSALEANRTALDVSRAAIQVGYGQIAGGILQTLVIAGGLLFMRTESWAGTRELVRRHEETMAAMQAQHEQTMSAMQIQYEERMIRLDMQRWALEALIERTSAH